MKSLLFAFTSLVLVYLAGAFVLWDANPANWSEGARFFVIWFGAGFGGFIYCFSKGEGL